MNDVYARLDTEAFAALVAGKPVDIPCRVCGEAGVVHLILADIGFAVMLEAIDAAMMNKQNTSNESDR